jgi:UDPglucose 6-dehydrogenase
MPPSADAVNIAVIGSGYVGLVASVCFAEMGHRVVCVDNDPRKLELHAQGIPSIHEQLLPGLLQRHLQASLHFTADLQAAAADAEVVFIAVGTPQREEGRADLSYVESVAHQIARSIRSYTVIAEKSTVPVYTNDWLRRLIAGQGVAAEQFDVVSNPEFLREGTAVSDFLHPNRIVVGAETERAMAVMRRVYAPLTSGRYYAQANAVAGGCSPLAPPPMLQTTAKSAELIKHASNAFLAMKISFINQVAHVCEAAGVDIQEVRRGIALDHRIGGEYLQPGIGYGGSCFSKDIAAFQSVAAALGIRLDLLAEVEKTNQQQRERFVAKVQMECGPLAGKKLAVLGLAFKSGTDDIRDSPALAIVQSLWEAGCTVVAFDPAAMPRAQQALGARERLHFAADEYAAAAGADALLILTDWPQFAQLDWARIRDALAAPRVLDGRNVCDPHVLATHGLAWSGIGRSRSTADVQPALAPTVHTPQPQPRILLTGAAGFLGSHLADRLVAEGMHVLGVDNGSTGSAKNLEHLRREPRFDLLEQDICAPFDPGAVDCILNFASPASPAQYMQRGPETLRAGSMGTQQMLELARRHHAVFLQASTSECYGTPLVHPQPENYWGNVNPIGPRSVYDESKRFSEALVMAYHRYHRVDVRLARIFNTYGPRMQPDDGRVISNFIMQALAGADLTVYGDGVQTRSFCYVSDLVEGILRLLRSRETMPVNLGNPDEFTILECARQVMAGCQSQSKITYAALPEDDPPQRRPDITRARNLLGWEPKIDLQQGLAQTIPYFRSLSAGA